MRKLRTVLSALATASMVFGTMGAAAAQGTGQWETRADFIFQLDKSLGIQPVYPATPDFQDVSPSSPYYGYIEAAFQLGITNGFSAGVFGPSLGITRAEAAKYLVVAYGAGSEAQNVTSTSFSDNGDIPSALVGYVGEAAALGLMKGFPGGTFQPDANLTVAQEGYLIGQLQTATSALTLKVTASATDVAPGQVVSLSTSATTASGAKVPSPVVTYSVTGTNASNALIAGDSFVASTAGNYTVQAAAGSSTATTTIGVYGAATSLKVNAPTSVVANGVSTKSVTVDVVDANGNIVGNNVDSISFTSSATAAAGFYVGAGLSAASAATAKAVNGVATFTLQSGNVAGSSTLLSASDNLLVGSATVSAAAQVPTSVAVTAASPYLTANSTAGSDTLSAMVLDQTGNPMLSGAYTVSFAATGPANFGGLSSAAGVYYGPSQAAATANLTDVQGATGAVSVTASATGLTSGTASVTAVIAGTPAKIAISAAQTEPAGTAGVYTVTIEDSHGYPVAWTGTVNLTDSDVSGSQTLSPASLAFNNQSTATFQVSDTVAGSYTVTAADAMAALTGATTTLAVTAGPLAGFSISPVTMDTVSATKGTYYASVSSPTWPVSVQLQDAYGNAVAESGVAVSFAITGSGTGSATLTTASGSVTSGLGGTAMAYTNASGVATANVTAQPYAGASYTVTATEGLISHSTTALVLAGNLATAPISVTATDPTSGAVVSSLVAGQTYNASFQLKDALGNNSAYANTVQVTLGGAGSATLKAGTAGTVTTVLAGSVYDVTTTSAGLGSFTITPGLAGPLTLTLQDLDVYGAASQATAFSVTPASQVAKLGFASGGAAVNVTTPLTMAAGSVTAVTVTAEDLGGNPIVAASTIPVALKVSGTVGSSYELRTTASGTDLVSPYVVDIPAGQSSVTFYIVNDAGATATAYFDSSTFAYTVTGSAAAATVATANTADLVTFTVADAGGKGVAGVSVTFAVSKSGADLGTISTTTGVTNASGQVTVTFTTPATWVSTDANTVTLTTVGVTPAGTGSVTISY